VECQALVYYLPMLFILIGVFKRSPQVDVFESLTCFASVLPSTFLSLEIKYLPAFPRSDAYSEPFATSAARKSL
jgi:hypothetical protein